MKKGFIFTLLVVVLFMLVLLTVRTWLKGQQTQEEMNAVVVRASVLSSTLVSISSEMDRMTGISGNGSIYYAAFYAGRNMTPLANSSAVISEIAWNSTLGGNETYGCGAPPPCNFTSQMANMTMSRWLSTLSQSLSGYGMGLSWGNGRATAVEQTGYYEVRLQNEAWLYLNDSQRVAAYNRTATSETYVDITGFEDPLFSIGTGGAWTRNVSPWPYPAGYRLVQTITTAQNGTGWVYGKATTLPGCCSVANCTDGTLIPPSVDTNTTLVVGDIQPIAETCPEIANAFRGVLSDYGNESIANLTVPYMFGFLEYQETADESEYDSAWVDGANVGDGDWDTYGYINTSTYGSAYYYANYTIPAWANANSVWQVKDGTGTENLTIPVECWDGQAKLQFIAVSMRTYGLVSYGRDTPTELGFAGIPHKLSFGGGGPVIKYPYYYAIWYCLDEDTQATYKLRGYASMSMAIGQVYEEGMFWDKSVGGGSGFAINTTDQFDNGTKSNSSGNYDVETYTDNLNITNNTLQLGNLFSDRFNFDDTDANTWKWTVYELDWGNLNVAFNDNIAGGAWNSEITINGDSEYADSNLVLNGLLTGDFDVQVDFSDFSYDANSISIYPGFVLSDTPDWSGAEAIGIYRVHDIWRTDLDFYMASSWGTGADQFSGLKNDASGKFRITRTGTEVKQYYWDNLGGAWALLRTNDETTDDLYVFLYNTNYADTSPAVESISFDNFKVNSGAMAASHRTSGTWTSETQIMPPGSKLFNLTLTLENGDGSSYVSQIDILNAADDSVLTTWTGAMESTTTLTGTDFDYGFDPTLSTDLKVMLYLTGSGSNSISVQQIGGAMGSNNFSAVITDWVANGTAVLINNDGGTHELLDVERLRNLTLNGAYYRPSANSGPDYLSRLENRSNSSPYGIESLVNFSMVNETTSDRPWVDYYFLNGTACDPMAMPCFKVKGTPNCEDATACDDGLLAHFRLDDGGVMGTTRLVYYNVDKITYPN